VLQGTLRDALNAHLLLDRTTGGNHKPTVLALALHVACAMQYLHKVRRLCCVQLLGPAHVRVHINCRLQQS
jgi:hypothetical protein